ncbi:MAG: metal ABC transporter permease [Clostridia bacterium]|nr:metal ABC transporter permease [Clostridia bacterium]
MIQAIGELFTYDFMRRAVLGVLLMMPLFSLLGTLVVNNGMAFFSDALGHSALTGAAIGLLFGLADPSPAMLIFAIVFALLMNAIRHSRLSSTDTVISVFASCGLALGLVMLSKNSNFSGYQSLLIGDILSITNQQLWILAGTLLAVVIVWVLCFNGFFAVALSPSLSRSKGLPAVWLDNLFVVVMAAVVMLSVRLVGLLLINAMLILPAASARNVAKGLRSYVLLALIFSLFSGLLGLLVSYLNALATGPTIVLIGAAVFFGTFVIARREKA